jgi:hypothetical protein
LIWRWLCELIQATRDRLSLCDTDRSSIETSLCMSPQPINGFPITTSRSGALALVQRPRFLNTRSTVHVILCSEGDQVYLFGFSRGAYTARVLAGMVESVRYVLANFKLLIFALILMFMLLGRSATKGKSLTGAAVCTFLAEESSRT